MSVLLSFTFERHLSQYAWRQHVVSDRVENSSCEGDSLAMWTTVYSCRPCGTSLLPPPWRREWEESPERGAGKGVIQTSERRHRLQFSSLVFISSALDPCPCTAPRSCSAGSRLMRPSALPPGPGALPSPSTDPPTRGPTSQLSFRDVFQNLYYY